ncbi:MAG: hypothetical protein CMI27_02830 [Opitutae bacterium]|nr:hypothetical protein [Opitutae bacterium]
MPTPNKLAGEMIVEMNAISKLIENVETQAEFDSISSDLNQHGQKLTEIGNRFKAMQADLTLEDRKLLEEKGPAMMDAAMRMATAAIEASKFGYEMPNLPGR